MRRENWNKCVCSANFSIRLNPLWEQQKKSRKRRAHNNIFQASTVKMSIKWNWVKFKTARTKWRKKNLEMCRDTKGKIIDFLPCDCFTIANKSTWNHLMERKASSLHVTNVSFSFSLKFIDKHKKTCKHLKSHEMKPRR